jgi:hypothetical protein
VVTLVFAGAIAVVVIALIVYPLLYLQDVSSAGDYHAAAFCEPGTQSNACRDRTTAEVSNVRSFDGRPEFDVLVDGKLVSVTRENGAYQPRNGDAVQLEVWRGQPVRVTGPDGSEMVTNQDPDAKLSTDKDVLGLFVFVGVFSLVTAVLVGWFGRRILFFGRFQGMSAPQLLKGLVLVICILLPLITLTLVGQAYGWLPQGKLGAWVAGLILAIFVWPPFFIYRWLRSRRAS